MSKGVSQHITNYYFIFLGIIGLLIVLASTYRYGIGFSPDSALYISTSRSLLSGQGFIGYDGSTYIYWPPLLPILLALMGLFGLDCLDAARYVNAISFGLIVFCSSFWIRENIKFGSLVLFGSFGVLLSVPVLIVSNYVWSEPIFILFSFLSLYILGKYLASQKSKLLFLSAIFVALACLTRYIGITIVFTGLLLLLFRRNKNFFSRLIDSTIFGFISILPITAWIVRNYMISSTLTGERFPSSFTLPQIFNSTFDIISQWLLFTKMPSMLRILIVCFLLISLIVILVAIKRRNKNCSKNTHLLQILPLFAFLLVYISFLFVCGLTTNISEINNRIMSPIYVPLILLLIFSIDNIRRFPSRKFHKQFLSYILIIGFCLWLIYPLQGTIKAIAYYNKNGAGYSSPLWHNSNLVLYLKENPLHGQIYSNVPGAIYILTGMPAKQIPRKRPENSPVSIINDLLQFKKSLSSGKDTYVVWFNNKYNDFLYTVPELRTIFDMTTVEISADGTIYFVKSNGQQGGKVQR